MQTRKEWLEARRTGLGSSDIAAVLGLGGSLIEVWRSKVEPAEDSEGTDRMAWGRRLEGVILDEYAERNNVTVRRFGTEMLRHPDHPWWIGTPDAAVIDEAGNPIRIVEAKNVGSDQAWKWGEDGGDIAPDAYIVQVCHQMPLVPVNEGDLTALIGGNDPRTYRIERDPALEEMIAEKGHDFWHRHVLPGIPPPMDGSDAASRWLRDKFRRVVRDVRPASEHEIQLARELVLAKANAKAAEAEAARLEQLLQIAIGDGEGLTLTPDGKVRITWGSVKGAVSWKSVAEAMGASAEFAEAYRGEPTRRMTLPRKEF